MNTWLQQLLRCPFCGGALTKTLEVGLASSELDYGLLGCANCRSPFPVVEGIPILLPAERSLDIESDIDGTKTQEGPRIGDIIRALQASDRQGALSLLLNPITLQGSRWTFSPAPQKPQRTQSIVPSGDEPVDRGAADRDGYVDRLRKAYRVLRNRYRRYAFPRWRRTLSRYIDEHRADLSAEEILRLYYEAYSNHEGYASYFIYRFGQPRHLAALSAASLLRHSKKPLLDVACGVGHLSHYLSYGRADAAVVGLDRSFFATFVAKKFVAPNAQFVCTPADGALPFADRTFEGVFCSDAFHYFRYKELGVREFLRSLADNGTLVLTRFGNRDVAPNEGFELDVAGYRRLFCGIPHAVRTESQLRTRYLQKTGPDLSAQGDGETSEQEKWLTLIASHDANLFRSHGQFEEWPHAVGRLGVNPIFVEDGNAEDGKAFRFQFPSKWYAYEDAAYREYAPASCRLSSDLLTAMNEGERADGMEAYLRNLVILGMPDRYVQRGAGPARRGAGGQPGTRR